jgi:hypothetical protein
MIPLLLNFTRLTLRLEQKEKQLYGVLGYLNILKLAVSRRLFSHLYKGQGDASA